MKKDRVHSFFKYQEEVLSGYIENLRKVVDHKLTKGEEVEEIIREFFLTFIPKRFNCTRGFIIDSDRKLSSQIDILIHDQMNIPSFFNYRGFNVLPIEAVNAIVEVKTTLTNENLEKTFANFKYIEDMKFNKEKFVTNKDNAVVLFETGKPERWILSYNSAWSSEEKLKKELKSIYQKYPELDFVKVFILNRGIVLKEDSLNRLELVVPKTTEGELQGVVFAWFLYQVVMPSLFNNPRGSKFWINYIPKGSYERKPI